MRKTYYCVNKMTKAVLSYGYLPETWGNITGMADLPAEEVSDLTWAGYPDHGFISIEEALKLAIPQLALDNAKAVSTIIQGDVVKAARDADLAATDWVAIRAQETNTPIPANYAVYRQALRDITSQSGFPWDVIPVTLK